MVVFEHTLFMILLLVGILNARPPNPKITILFVLGGVLLALVPPFLTLPLPWDLILYLTIPLLFWQNARRWLQVRWRAGWQELLLWLLTTLSLTAVLSLTGYLSWTASLLFGAVASGMLWRAAETDQGASPASQVGALTLVFLLTEIATAVDAPNRYMGELFSGIAVGAAAALLGVYFSPRFLPSIRGWLAVIQVYAAFGLATLLGVSGVAAALVSIAVYTEFSLRREIFDAEMDLPAPINNWLGFSLLLGLFVILGWQAHQPLTPSLLLESSLGLPVGLATAWLGKRLGVPGFERSGIIWRSGLRVGLFLFAALLLWPRTTLVEPLPLAIALGLAILLSLLSLTLLTAAEEMGL